jgi:hypothetical protein
MLVVQKNRVVGCCATVNRQNTPIDQVIFLQSCSNGNCIYVEAGGGEAAGRGKPLLPTVV